ncbi:hypothetical protein URH17368_0888 [Alicyclobacillus hesperidum URH17-3-68]|nr:hypothetical protein URH17368_0888 [Alicyclobacillus hesperidum URH17-3-68]
MPQSSNPKQTVMDRFVHENEGVDLITKPDAHIFKWDGIGSMSAFLRK